MAILDKGTWYPNRNLQDLVVEDSFLNSASVEAGRYHLYMSHACPFAHRVYLVVKLLGLEHLISVSSVAATRTEDGWVFDQEYPDDINHQQSLTSLYTQADATYSGRVSVPILWDKWQNTIVSNDSASMAMDLATKWLPLAKNTIELVPENLKEEIISLNTWLHANVNRKVYHVGFAADQLAYDTANDVLFSSLDELDQRLKDSRYLHGNQITLSDLFLLPTLVRFESVYEVHFKANKKPIMFYQHLYRYMLELVAETNIRDTIDIEYTKTHYYCSHKHINPTGIVPTGPHIAW